MVGWVVECMERATLMAAVRRRTEVEVNMAAERGKGGEWSGMEWSSVRRDGKTGKGRTKFNRVWQSNFNKTLQWGIRCVCVSLLGVCLLLWSLQLDGSAEVDWSRHKSLGKKGT